MEAAHLFGKVIETAGVTSDQLERMFKLGDELDRVAGTGTAKALLRERFGLSSRKELTEDRGNEYLALLHERLREAEPLDRVARKAVGPYRITRSDYRGAHRYDVFDRDGEVVAEKLPGITTTLNTLDKPALLHWIANLTGDAFKREIRRVLIDESPGNVAQVRAMLLPLLDVDGYKLANETKKAAGERGTDAHAIAEIIANRARTGEPIDDDAITAILKAQENLAADDVYLCVLAIREWFARIRPSVLGAESMVACLHCGCAATLDLHCVIDHPRWGGEWILDIKTSSGVYESHALQTSFQAHALMQMKRGLHERHCAVYRRLRIGTLWVNHKAEDGCEIVEFDNTATTLGAVQKVIGLYGWKRKNAWRKRTASFPRNASEVAETVRQTKARRAEMTRGAA